MATSQIVAVYRQNKKQDKTHRENSENHSDSKVKLVSSGELEERSYCCSTCCCLILSSDERPHAKHLNRRKDFRHQENYKTIHKAKEVKTMDINKNGNLRNRVSFLFDWILISVYGNELLRVEVVLKEVNSFFHILK